MVCMWFVLPGDGEWNDSVAGVLVSHKLVHCLQFSTSYVSPHSFRTDHEDDISNSTFLIVSCSIVAANVFFALVRSFSFAYGGLKAARSIYRQLTTSTLRTYLHFFEIQSLGRLLNRFGNDSECIDEDVPFMLNIVLAQVGVFLLMLLFDRLSVENLLARSRC